MGVWVGGCGVCVSQLMSLSARRTWAKANLLHHQQPYRNLKVDSGPVPYGDQFGVEHRAGMLSNMLQPDSRNLSDSSSGKQEATNAKSNTNTKVDMHGNPYYIFTNIADDKSEAATRMRSEYPWLPPFLDYRELPVSTNHTVPVSHQFFVGGKGQGAPIHFHGTISYIYKQ